MFVFMLSTVDFLTIIRVHDNDDLKLTVRLPL